MISACPQSEGFLIEKTYNGPVDVDQNTGLVSVVDSGDRNQTGRARRSAADDVDLSARDLSKSRSGS